MSAGVPIHPEILFSLADEIRQTIAWLGDRQDPPAAEVTSRIRTLREAATVAGLESVGSILTGLDQELAAAKEPATRIELVLDRLSSAILGIANSIEDKQLEWVESAREIEQTLDRIDLELGRGADRLTGSLSLLETASMAHSDEDRRNLVLRSTVVLREEIARQRRLRDRLREPIAVLRTGTRKLTGDLSGLLAVPLLPALFKLREKIRVLGRDLGKPISLHPRCSGVEVSRHQIEPLVRVLEHLANNALQEGIESPQQRRKAGKPTVGVLRITAKAGKSILEIGLEDDGRTERPEVELPRATQNDLVTLRARLLQEPGEDNGRQLTLQVPVCRSTMEVIPVDTPGGEMLVPLAVVGKVFSGNLEPHDDVPVISLQRRAADGEHQRPESGIVFEIGGWRGVLYAGLLNTHFRVVPSQPEAGDPPWVIGRVRSGEAKTDTRKGRPVIHPLPFMKLTEEQVCLFPSVER
jgi:hypothetical protein